MDDNLICAEAGQVHELIGSYHNNVRPGCRFDLVASPRFSLAAHDEKLDLV